MKTIQKQIAKLESLTNCPVCGTTRSYTLGGRKGRKLFFLCGSVFFCHPGAPIGALIPCPRPSETAAELLNLEIVQADHTKQIQAAASSLSPAAEQPPGEKERKGNTAEERNPVVDGHREVLQNDVPEACITGERLSPPIGTQMAHTTPPASGFGGFYPMNGALGFHDTANRLGVLRAEAKKVRDDYERAYGKPCDCATADAALYYGRAQGLEMACDRLEAAPRTPNRQGEPVGEIVVATSPAAEVLFGRDVKFYDAMRTLPIGTRLYAGSPPTPREPVL